MFVRIKKIKGYQYAYLVENSWKQGSSRQRVKAYLGRVYNFDCQEKLFAGMLDGNFQKIVLELLKWQLSCYGFAIAKNSAVNGGLRVNLDTLKFVQEKTGKPFVLQGKDGYLCQHTLKNLLQFKSAGYEEQVGRALAHALVDAGIDVPKDIFIKIFEKVYKPED